MDREVRVLRLRLVARRAVKALRADERDLLAAYTRGRTRASPRSGPRPSSTWPCASEPVTWRDEDSLLCALAMYRDLQGRQPGQESHARPDAGDAPAGARRVPRPRRHRVGRADRGRADPDARRPGAGGRRPAAGAARGGRGPAASPRPSPALSPSSACRSASGRRTTTTSSAAATTGRWRGRTPRTAARSSPTTCTSASPCPTPGTGCRSSSPGWTASGASRA